jgi:hypothetical protein
VLLVVPVVVFVLVLWLQSPLSCSQSSAFRCSQPEQHVARPCSSCWPSASTERISLLLLTGPFPLCTTGIRFSSARSMCYSWCRLYFPPSDLVPCQQAPAGIFLIACSVPLSTHWNPAYRFSSADDFCSSHSHKEWQDSLHMQSSRDKIPVWSVSDLVLSNHCFAL